MNTSERLSLAGGGLLKVPCSTHLEKIFIFHAQELPDYPDRLIWLNVEPLILDDRRQDGDEDLDSLSTFLVRFSNSS